MLVESGVPYVIENVEGAPLRSPLRLRGQDFPVAVNRPRLFECSFTTMSPPRGKSRKSVAVYGKRPGDRLPDGVERARDLAHGRSAMGIDWMEWPELTQAIPPAYSEHIGRYAMIALGRTEA